MRLIAVAAACALLFGACASKSPSTSAQRLRSTATIQILSPRSGETIDRNDVVVKIKLNGGTLTKTVTTHTKPDVGHIHLRLDGATITLLGSLEEKIPAPKPGQHILEAEFVDASHTPFDPRVLSTVSFVAR